jgi:hypothetical protein
MFNKIFRLLPFLAASALFAQPAQTGISPEWDIRKTMEAIATHTSRLLPVLDQIDPKTWVSKGAPDTYVAQWNSSKAQAKALVKAAQDLSRAPEKLAAQLEAYFRLQGLETTLPKRRSRGPCECYGR